MHSQEGRRACTPQFRRSASGGTRTPTGCEPHWDLNPARLPIPPRSQGRGAYWATCFRPPLQRPPSVSTETHQTCHQQRRPGRVEPATRRSTDDVRVLLEELGRSVGPSGREGVGATCLTIQMDRVVRPSYHFPLGTPTKAQVSLLEDEPELSVTSTVARSSVTVSIRTGRTRTIRARGGVFLLGLVRAVPGHRDPGARASPRCPMSAIL